MHLQGLRCKVTVCMSEGRARGQMAVSTCRPTCMSRLMRTSSLRWKGEMTLHPHTFGVLKENSVCAQNEPNFIFCRIVHKVSCQ